MKKWMIRIIALGIVLSGCSEEKKDPLDTMIKRYNPTNKDLSR